MAAVAIATLKCTFLFLSVRSQLAPALRGVLGVFKLSVENTHACVSSASMQSD